MIRWTRLAAVLALIVVGAASCAKPPEQADPVDDRATDVAWRLPTPPPQSLVVSDDGRRLERRGGEPFFVLGDSAWALVWKLGRSDIAEYLSQRKEHGFNVIAVRAFCSRHTDPNAYDDLAFAVRDGEFDFAQPLETVGASAASDAEYDYWDHLEYFIDRAASLDQYIFLSPVHGRFISGTWDARSTDGILLDAQGAYDIGRWFGRRYGDKSNVVWVLGGDRNAVAVSGTRYLTEYRALAEGVADGVNGAAVYDGKADYATTTMTFWPRKYQPNSSYWFHHDDWLDFNSIQEITLDAVQSIDFDRSLTPPKPTFLFEGRYEKYGPDWTDYQARLQAYQGVFAGGFGHLYGHEQTYFFGVDWHRRAGDREVWRKSVLAPGAMQMKHMRTLMERGGSVWAPAPLIVDGVRVTEDRYTSNRVHVLIARQGDRAMAYSANGRNFTLDLSQVRAAAVSAAWFNPRSGKWHLGGQEFDDARAFETGVLAGHGAGERAFDPPGDSGSGNDWVLLLEPAALSDPATANTD